MREPFTQLYVHVVWSTWDRLPLLTDDIREAVFSAIAVKCREMKCKPLAIGGIDNHVHVLVRFLPTLMISELVQAIKGCSSHLVTHVLKPGAYFKWQGGYSAYTLRDEEVEQVRKYIENQARHHADQSLASAWESHLQEETSG